MKKRDVIDITEKQKGENTLVLQRIVLLERRVTIYSENSGAPNEMND